MRMGLAGVMLAVLAGPALAQDMSGAVMNQAMTPRPASPGVPPGYLDARPGLDAMTLLPPPPVAGSPQAEADLAAYRASAAGIGGDAWNRAITQLNPAAPQFFQQLSCAVGRQLSPQKTPTVMAMIARAGVDFAGPMARAKAGFARQRPFTTDGGKACDPASADGKGEALGLAYPSGHAGIGWLWALLLAEAAPERATQIRAFGQETGDLRIACRVHWLSDVAAGRALGALTYQAISATREYQADAARAREELADAPPATGCAGR